MNELPPGAIRPTSRWARSTVTYGPAGRVLWTLLLLVPVWWCFSYGVVGLFGLTIWGVWILPRALKDVWRQTRKPYGQY